MLLTLASDVVNIRDAIHGFISLNELEQKIIQEPHFQRLRFIHQLGTTDWVYPSAVHSRFEHSLGVFHLASSVVDRIQKYLSLTNQDVEIFKVACLLHDIGHGPFATYKEAEAQAKKTGRIVDSCGRCNPQSPK